MMGSIKKKMYYEDLPMRGKHIEWDRSIGKKVNFVYGEIKGEIEIINYEKSKHMLTIKYLDSEFNIHTNGFRKCSLGEMLKVKTVDYKFTLGSIINNMKLLEQKRMKRREHTEKGYSYQCMKCGYIGEMYEYQINANVGCQVCANRIIVKGINDIATTSPEYLKYFVDINDAYKYSRSANREIKVNCPDCGYVKQMTINTLTNMGFSCNKCGDGISYPEKYIFNLMEQLNINFETRKCFDWSKGKEYDFYIPIINCVIETHGVQHYDGGFERHGGRSLKEEQENDKLKLLLAKENNIKNYIVLDCRESNLEWIKKSVINSDLNVLFNLEEIEWTKCDIGANSSKLRETCKLWNEGLGVTDISKILKISHSTAIKYLHKGTELNLCNYINANKPKGVAVYDLNQQKLGVFESINQLARESKKFFGVKFSSGCISLVCRGIYKTHKGFKFEFIK